MSGNPFDRNKTKEAKLGQLITEPGEQNQRDAVHIAVVPVEAGCSLKPGQRVGVTANGKIAAPCSEPVGIVDPYLESNVQSGQTFWLFLFQGSVNTLRHEWTHDAFPSVSATPAAPAVESSERIRAEARMRDFAERECGFTLAKLLEKAKSAVEYGDGIFMGDTEGVCAYPQFMEDLRTLTGIDITGKEAPYFTCSC